MSDTIDAARPAPPRLPPPPPPPPPSTTDATSAGGGAARPVASPAQAREAVAGGAAVNELRGAAGQEILGSARATQAPPVEPAMQAGGDLDAAYRDAGATPPARDAMTAGATPTGADAPTTPAEPETGPAQPATAAEALADANDRGAALQRLADRAGEPRIQVGSTRLDPGRMNQRAAVVSRQVLNGEPTSINGQPRELQRTDQERADLASDDPARRQRAADAIGRRGAQREWLERAVGGPENADRIERAYQASTPQQQRADAPQRDREGNAQRLAAVGTALSFAVPAAGLANLARLGLLRAGAALAGRFGAGAATTTARGLTDAAVRQAFNPANMTRQGGHATQHLREAGVIANRGSLASQREAAQRVAEPILKNPTERFLRTFGERGQMTTAEVFTGTHNGRPIWFAIRTDTGGLLSSNVGTIARRLAN